MLNGALFKTAWSILRLLKEAKRQLGRPKRRLVDNIKMDFKKIGGVVKNGLT
jgi:hypothetical protein